MDSVGSKGRNATEAASAFSFFGLVDLSWLLSASRTSAHNTSSARMSSPFDAIAGPINLGNGAYVQHLTEQIPADADEFEDLWDMSNSVPPKRNPFNSGTFCMRLEATLSPVVYTFSGQRSHQLAPDAASNSLIERVADDVKARCDPRVKEQYTIFHINWYRHGGVGIHPHFDDEACIVPDSNIYSYTFLSDAKLPRPFQVYEADGKQLKEEFVLGHGDLFVMGGTMQRFYKHGIKKTSAKRFAALRRVNITVRAHKSV